MPSKNQKQAKAAASKRIVEVLVQKPQWPPLRPLVPTSDLFLDTAYVSFLSRLPLATTPGVPKKGEALRVNDRFQIEDPGFAEQLWSSTALKELVGQSQNDWGGEKQTFVSNHVHVAAGTAKINFLTSTVRILAFLVSALWAWPDDESNILVLPATATTPQTPAKTTWTLLIYLTSETSGCIGGETVFYPELGQAKSYSGKSPQGTEPISIAPEVGLALLHKHGNDCLLHEGKMVTAGEKWVIRSDLCVKR